MRRRISAVLLTLCMLMSLVPSVAFAAPNGTFDDVNDHWGKNAIERWAGYGVVNGDGSGNFAPDKQMTRAEFATMLANMLGYKEKAANTFADVNDSDWFADAILKLAAAGVMQGSNGMANPNAPISRQEAAVMMCRAFNIPTTGGNLNFADSADVADWAKGAVAALAARGMMNGVGGNNVAPLAEINRASVATLLDNMITEYVTEDKTITGEVSGIVLVAAGATVTLEDATLNENLIVAPKADGAEVTLTGTTTAGDVVVSATATVKVDSTASAGTVQVEAANSTVEVAGKADAVTVDTAANNTAVNVTESAAVGDVALNAADTKVSVAENATVSNVAVSGSNANVEVSGKVDNVTVSSEATGTDITANSGATVGKVETSANDVTVSGSGKVENVTANDGTVAVTTPGTNVENKTDSADNVTNNGKPVPPTTGGDTPTPPSSSGGSGGSSGGSNVASADVVKANIHDNASKSAIDDDKLGDVTVTGTVKTAATAESGPVYSVEITGRNIMNHTNASSVEGHWVGFGFPAAGDGVSRTIKVGETTITDRTQETNGKTYNTVYFSEDTEAAFEDASYTVVVEDTKDESTVTSKYEVTFDVTFWKANVTIENVTAETNETDFAVKSVENAVKDVTVTANARSGENIPVTMAATNKTLTELVDYTPSSGSDNGNRGYYSYYNMKITPVSNVTLKLKNGGEGYGEGLNVSGMNLATATKLFDASYTKLNPTHTYTVVDAAGRTQDTFKVVITNNVTLAGATTLTVNFENAQGDSLGSETFSWVGDNDNGTKSIKVPTLTSNENTYYTNKWKTTDEGAFGNAPTTVSKPERSGEVNYVVESYSIKGQTITTRPNGPADGQTSFEYGKAYEAAGVKLSGTPGNYTYTITPATFLEYSNKDGNDLEKLASEALGSKYYYYGVAIMAPNSSAAKMVITKDKNPTSLNNDDGCDEFVLSSNGHAFDTDGDNVKDCILHYFGAVAVKDKGDVFAFQQDATFTRYVKWLDGSGNIIAVNKFVLARKTESVPTYTVTFTGDGVTASPKTVAYGGTISELPTATKTGSTFDGWYYGDGNNTKFETSTVVTKNIELTAKWTTETNASVSASETAN